MNRLKHGARALGAGLALSLAASGCGGVKEIFHHTPKIEAPSLAANIGTLTVRPALRAMPSEVVVTYLTCKVQNEVNAYPWSATPGSFKVANGDPSWGNGEGTLLEAICAKAGDVDGYANPFVSSIVFRSLFIDLKPAEGATLTKDPRTHAAMSTQFAVTLEPETIQLLQKPTSGGMEVVYKAPPSN